MFRKVNMKQYTTPKQKQSYLRKLHNELIPRQQYLEELQRIRAQDGLDAAIAYMLSHSST